MTIRASDIDPADRSRLLQQLEDRLGWYEYQQLVATYGEDGLLERLFALGAAQSQSVRAPQGHRGVPELGARPLRVVSMVAGAIMGLGLGLLAAVLTWLLHSGGVPYRHLTASTFHGGAAVLLVVCLCWLFDGKADFRLLLLLYAVVDLLGGLIGICQWAGDLHWRPGVALGELGKIIVMPITYIVFGLCIIVNIFSSSNNNSPDLLCVMLHVGAPIGVFAFLMMALIDAPHDPLGMLPSVGPFTTPKLLGYTVVTGGLLGALAPLRAP